jgi:hypothetical protein
MPLYLYMRTSDEESIIVAAAERTWMLADRNGILMFVQAGGRPSA